jgi:hypothetical protein
MRKGFKNSRPRDEDEDDDLQPDNPEGYIDPEIEPLWNTYRIKKDWPLRAKVELLLSVWKLTPSVISALLEMKEKDVKRFVSEIHEEWEALGKSLGPKEKIRERGRLIADLENIKSQLDQQLLLNHDPKIIAQKITIVQQLAKLRGIDADKSVAEDIEGSQTFEDKLRDKIGVDQLEAMVKQLKVSQPEGDES